MNNRTYILGGGYSQKGGQALITCPPTTSERGLEV